ncbi:MAG: hypothetical protein AAF184_09585 [Pseudomonadota bacterium]
MSVNVTIRHVPEEVRDGLAEKARQAGKSMQEYLLEELERLAHSPSVDRWIDAVRERKARYNSRVSTEQVLAARDADRK